MAVRLMLLVIACLIVRPVPAAAEPVVARDLAAENEDLRDRVSRLEGELEKVKELLRDRESATPSSAVDGEEMSTALEALLAKYATPGHAASEESSGFELKPYGFIKLDMSYDSAGVSNGNFVSWVESGEYDDDGDRTSITARQTRIGLSVGGPVDGVDLSGKIELDFYGSGAENKPQPYMRHAYLELDWKDCGWSLLAGQTWDVVSPLNPSTLNYPVAWWAGNWGYRRPQIRVTKVSSVGENASVSVAVAATRNIGDQSAFDSADAGADSAIPVFQARVALTLPILDAPKPATIGLWGHWGTEEYDTDREGGNDDYTTSSVGIDVTLPIREWLTLQGEFYAGQDLDAYLGGIGQGVNLSRAREIHAMGGWLAGSCVLDSEWTLNSGFSLEDVDEDDLSAGGRSRNRSIWANVMWSPLQRFTTGIELSHWKTDYKKLDDGTDFRVQMSFIYKF